MGLRKQVRPSLWAEVTPLLFGRARVILTDGSVIEDAW